MGPEFLGRIVKTSLLLSVGLALVAGWYFGIDRGVDFGFAALWGTLNLKMLQKVIVEATRPRASGWRPSYRLPRQVSTPLRDGRRLDAQAPPDPAATFAGLSLVLAVILLKSLGRLLLDSAWFSRPMARGGEDR
jgi:hypothetical protein